MDDETTSPMDAEASERVLREEQRLLAMLAAYMRAERPTVPVTRAALVRRRRAESLLPCH